MSTEKEFIPYQEALTLKELGFDELCHRGWDEDYKIWYHPDSSIVVDNPTFSQAFRWFREKYGLFYFEDHRCNSKIDINSRTYWMGIKKFKLTAGSEVVVGLIQMGCFNTYEEAELACLRKLIEIVKSPS